MAGLGGAEGEASTWIQEPLSGGRTSPEPMLVTTVLCLFISISHLPVRWEDRSYFKESLWR